MAERPALPPGPGSTVTSSACSGSPQCAQRISARVRQPDPAEGLPVEGSERAAQLARVMASAQDLRDHFHEVPIFMIPCVHPRADEAADSEAQCSLYGGVMPAAWSFQLAARARGLASCWTTLHLIFEREIAELLGIDYTQTQQVAGIFLESAGLVKTRRAGRYKFHYLNTEPLEHIADRWLLGDKEASR